MNEEKNKEFKYIMKNAKALEKSCLLIKGVTETVRNEVKELKGGYLGMLAATLGSDY